MMQETKHIIARFWAGTATDAEKHQLARRSIQDELVWREQLKREFDQSLTATDKPLTDTQSKRVLLRLHRQIEGEATRRPAIYSLPAWIPWVAAAVMLLVVGIRIYQSDQMGPPVAPAITQHHVRLPFRLQRLTNTSLAVKHMVLADGSTLDLQPGSSLSYYEPFGKPSRTISMTGDATFSVAKDPAHPFMVLANGFSTTALGTKFRVWTPEQQRVLVRLYEGRVVVRATPETGLTMRDVYLKPGQEINLNRKTKEINLYESSPDPVSRPVGKPSPPVPTMQFIKEPLTAVFAEVGKRYHVQIDFDPADVQGLSFSGSFTGADSLRVVLGAVCTTNDLSFKQEADTVTIRKLP